MFPFRLPLSMLSFLAAFMLAPITATTGWASPGQEVMHLGGRDASITGEIISIDGNRVEIRAGQGNMTVTLTGLTAGTTMATLLEPGMQITARGSIVRGMFNDPILEAREVMVVQPMQPAPQQQPAQQPAPGITP